MLGFLLTCVLVLVALAWLGQSHNKPGATLNGPDRPCQYCWFDIKRGQKMVFGKKGWGHVECVEFARPRKRNRW